MKVASSGLPGVAARDDRCSTLLNPDFSLSGALRLHFRSRLPPGQVALLSSELEDTRFRMNASRSVGSILRT